jgi:hypothetical protein
MGVLLMSVTHILVDFENTQPSAQDVALLREANQYLWIFRGPSQKKYDAEFTEALLPLADRVRVIKCEKSGRNAVDMHIAFQMGRLLGELKQTSGAAPVFAFVVVSRDTDYEPLLQYIRAQGQAARRVTSVREALGTVASQAIGVAKATKTRASQAATASKAGKAEPKSNTVKKKAKVSKTVKIAGKAVAARSAVKEQATEAAAAKPVAELVDTVIDYLRDHPKHRPTRRDRMEAWLASHLRSKLAGNDLLAIVAALEQRGVVRFAGKKIDYPLWS